MGAVRGGVKVAVQKFAAREAVALESCRCLSPAGGPRSPGSTPFGCIRSAYAEAVGRRSGGGSPESCGAGPSWALLTASTPDTI